MFVKKSLACSIGDLAFAIKELFKAKNEIKIIGTRHGEKLYETLLTREEMAKTEDCGDYFRISAEELFEVTKVSFEIEKSLNG